VIRYGAATRKLVRDAAVAIVGPFAWDDLDLIAKHHGRVFALHADDETLKGSSGRLNQIAPSSHRELAQQVNLLVNVMFCPLIVSTESDVPWGNVIAPTVGQPTAHG
jgi:hypothetical protein